MDMAEKETQFEKIKRISKKKENIRNICTSAHIHHGKCVAGDSRIMLTDGSIKTAKEIFEGISKDGEVFEENDEHTILTQAQDSKVVDLMVREKLDSNGYGDFKFIVSDIISADISIL